MKIDTIYITYYREWQSWLQMKLYQRTFKQVKEARLQIAGMGWVEWAFLIVILAHGYQTYRNQNYWLDRQVARLIRYVRSLLRRK